MKHTADCYLEAATTEEYADKLRADGYDVKLNVPALESKMRYDLLATRNGETIAFEVKARSQYAGAVEQIRNLRQTARSSGINEFRLVLVNPPRQTVVSIEGFQAKLPDYLRQEVPQEIRVLAPSFTLENVYEIKIDNIKVDKEGISLTGAAVVRVGRHYHSDAPEGQTEYEGYPLSFDLTLDHEINIKTVKALCVDTSAFYE